MPRLTHSGSGPGSASVPRVYPKDELAIAVLANLGNAEVSRLADGIAGICLGNRLGNIAKQPGSMTPGAFMIIDEHIQGVGLEQVAPFDPQTAASIAWNSSRQSDRWNPRKVNEVSGPSHPRTKLIWRIGLLLGVGNSRDSVPGHRDGSSAYGTTGRCPPTVHLALRGPIYGTHSRSLSNAGISFRMLNL